MKRPHQRHSRKKTGFTLIELVICLMIMGILAAVAAPKYITSINRFRAEAAARRIAADLNHVRNRAIMKGPTQEEWVEFYTNTEEYELLDDPDLDRPSEEYWVRFADTPYPVDIVSCEFTNTEGYTSNNRIKFNLYGRAVCGVGDGNPPISSGQIIVASGDEQRTVVIDPDTGISSVQ